MRKTPYLCNRFPEKRKRHKRAIFDEIYINNTVVQERNWKQFRVNKRTVSTYIYIGNELLIRNPDRANDRPYSVRDMVIKRYFYNEEFDPGSG